jgi:hypothetical protein
MKNDTRENQAQQIVHQLASLPGGQSLDVIEKKLPRIGPAETGSGYHVSTRSFTVRELPQALSIPSDSEEVIIRLHGSLDQGQVKDSLVSQLHSFFKARELHESWDVRAHFRKGRESAPEYELTVFSQTKPATQTAWV